MSGEREQIMRDADRQISLREIIDRLPLGKRQRQLAEESFDSMSEAEAESTVELYQEVEDGLPTALAAARRIRGMTTATQVKSLEAPTHVSREPAQQAAATTAKFSRWNLLSKHEAAAQLVNKLGIAETSTFTIVAQQKKDLKALHKNGVVVAHVQYSATFSERPYKRHFEKRRVVNKEDAKRMAKRLLNSIPRPTEHHLDTYIDKNGKKWNVYYIEGSVQGNKVEVFKAHLATQGKDIGGRRRTDNINKAMVVRLNGEVAPPSNTAATELLYHVHKQRPSQQNALTLQSSATPRR